jgi:hypothetical protein
MTGKESNSRQQQYCVQNDNSKQKWRAEWAQISEMNAAKGAE